MSEAALPLVRFISPWTDVPEDAGYIERTLQLSTASSQVVTVVVQAESYRAGDMDVSPQTVTFQPGQTTAVVRTAIYDDAVYEASEIFSLNIVSVTNAVVDLANYGDRSIAYILDNDAPTTPLVRFVGPWTDVSEGAGYVERTLQLSIASSEVVTVVVQAESYRAGDMDVSPQTVTFQPGQTTAVVRTAIYDDAIYEASEIFSLNIVSVTNATADLANYGDRSIAYILDNDAPTGPRVSAVVNAPHEITEGSSGALSITFLDASTVTTSVTVSVSGHGSATGDDAVLPLGSHALSLVQTPSGDYTLDLGTITALDDLRHEGVETIVLTISASGQTFANGSDTIEVSIQLLDNDRRAVANDFNGDGRSDLAWREAGGTFSTWLAADNAGHLALIPNAFYTGGVDSGWKLDRQGDFNGDGKVDLLWRHDGGAFTVWESTGNGFTLNALVDGSVSSDWRLAAVADFNGDGKDDLIWRHADGTFTKWRSNGAGFDKNVYVKNGVTSDWSLAGNGDFNGDGKADLLWRHGGGAFTIWQSTGEAFTPNAVVDGSVSSDWKLASVADFNGDGKDDLIWRHADGTFTEWRSNGAGFDQNVYVNNGVTPDWSLERSGDFNGDGKADLLWRHDGGAFTIWESTGDGFIANTLIEASVASNWDLV